MLLDFGHLNYPENQDLTTQRSEKSCSVENWGNFESIISANSSFSKNRKSTLLRGVNLPEILEETHTGMTVWSIPVKPYAHTHTDSYKQKKELGQAVCQVSSRHCCFEDEPMPLVQHHQHWHKSSSISLETLKRTCSWRLQRSVRAVKVTFEIWHASEDVAGCCGEFDW